jgi:hypothetical protein
MAETLPFDEVRVEQKAYTVDDFLQLPLHERIRYMLSGMVAFFRDGAQVDQTDALKALRDRSAG